MIGQPGDRMGEEDNTRSVIGGPATRAESRIGGITAAATTRFGPPASASRGLTPEGTGGGGGGDGSPGAGSGVA